VGRVGLVKLGWVGIAVVDGMDDWGCQLIVPRCCGFERCAHASWPGGLPF